MRNQFEIRGDITVIFLRRRDGTIIETLIDTCDLPRAQEFPNSWGAYWHEDIHGFYVAGTIRIKDGKKTTVYLHRWLTEPSNSIEVDHKYHNTLDNRSSYSLRIVTRSQNQQNFNGLVVTNKSGYRGVYWQKDSKKWVAYMMLNKRQIHLGYFNDKDEAGRVALDARQRYMPYAVFENHNVS